MRTDQRRPPLPHRQGKTAGLGISNFTKSFENCPGLSADPPPGLLPVAPLRLMRFPRRCFLVHGLAVVSLALPAWLSAAAPLRLSGLFRDGVVLQREQAVPVWGWAEPAAEVQVAFHGVDVRTTVAGDGRWRVDLPAMPADPKGATLSVRAGRERCEVRDVVVGEVWLCSGQSNMEWMVSQVEGAEREIASANFPLIRQFRVPKEPSEQPRDDVKGDWQPVVPSKVGLFTGVGYFFARDVHRALGGVPVGLINASWGGKMIEVFTPPSAIARTPHGAAVQRRWEIEQKDLTTRRQSYPEALARWTAARDEAQHTGTPFNQSRPQDPFDILRQHRPGCAFNAMIAPLIPYGLRGVLWYQGEHNISRPGEYRAMFGALIADWRERFGQGDLPFYFVQLSSFAAPMDKTRFGFAELREAQARTLEVANTGMAVSIDVGTPDNIHPRNKQDVGARLARIALKHTYGQGGEWSGPVLRSATAQGSRLRLAFDHASGGLVLRPVGTASSFEVAGSDGVFHAGETVVDGDAVLVHASAVSAPRAVRYAWANAPAATLFNTAGLPASPFRFSLP